MRPAAYEAHPGFSYSAAKLVLDSPAKYRLSLDQRREPTHAMELGSLIDALLFEQPTDWAHIKELNWATKEGKAERAEFEANGWTAFTTGEYTQAVRTAFTVRAHPDAGPLIAGADYQVELYGTDPAGLPIKGLLDCLQAGLIVDGKKTVDASAWAFSRQAGNLGYAIQAAVYLDLAEQNDLGVCEFKHVVYEIEPPHRVAVYQLDDDSLTYGWRQWRTALDIYARCLETDTWPDFPFEQPQRLRLPEYLLKKTATAYTADLPEFDWNTLT